VQPCRCFDDTEKLIDFGAVGGKEPFLDSCQIRFMVGQTIDIFDAVDRRFVHPNPSRELRFL